MCLTRAVLRSDGCWIGFEDSASEGGFVWTDGSEVNFVHFAPGEPNGGTGESAVAIDLRGRMGDLGGLRNGEWNDDRRNDDEMLYPLCQTSIPRPPAGCGNAHTSGSVVTSALDCPGRIWGSGSRTRLNIKICVDDQDTIFFQDDRLWVQYGGNYGAAGATWCPGDASVDPPDETAFRGKAYVIY